MKNFINRALGAKKKLFSILAVALFALSAHATVLTKDITLSGFDKDRETGISWNAETKVITAENSEWPAIQKWEAIETTDYEELVLELAEPSSIGINLWVQYSDDTQADVTIAAGETSKGLPLKPLSLSIIKIRATAVGTATLSKLYLKGYAGKVKEEVVEFDQYNHNGALGNWDNSLQAWSGHFGPLGLQVDDKLVINYTLSGNGDQFRIFACADADNVFDFASTNGSIINPEAGSTSIAFPLNSADLARLTSKGLKIDGQNMTITGISVLKHAVLWTGEKEIGEWTNTFDIPSSKLSDLQVGNVLCLRVSEIGTEGSPRVALAYGDSWNDFDPEVVYFFQEGDEAPMEVEFPITYKMEQQLRGHKLVIRGVNYTVTDIYVKEGTPTNTVAGYLNVTEAGMATLVLPFNVPSPLPDGVQAYNLTNNGDPTIWATEVDALEADKPVLIVAAEGEYEFISEEGASDDITSKTGTFTNGALVGTYTTIDHLDQQTSGAYNYILSNGADGVGFYQVRDASCSVAPYRAYLSCGYNNASTPSSAPKMRIVFHQDTTTGVESILPSEVSNQKVLRNGQLFILRNGVEYNANGALIK